MFPPPPNWFNSYGCIPSWSSSAPMSSSLLLDPYSYYLGMGPPLPNACVAEGTPEWLDASVDRPSATFEGNTSAHHSRPSVFAPTGMMAEGLACPKSSASFFPTEAWNTFAMNTSRTGHLVNSNLRPMDSMHYQPSSTCPSKAMYASTSTTVSPSECNRMLKNERSRPQNRGPFSDLVDPLLCSPPTTHRSPLPLVKLSRGINSDPKPSPKQQGRTFGKANRQSSPSSRPDSSTPAELQNTNNKANEMSGSLINSSEKENKCSSLLGQRRTAPPGIRSLPETMDLNAKVTVQEGNPATEKLPLFGVRTAAAEPGVQSSINCGEKENQCSSLRGQRRTAPFGIRSVPHIMDLNAKVVVQEGNKIPPPFADDEPGVKSSINCSEKEKQYSRLLGQRGTAPLGHRSVPQIMDFDAKVVVKKGNKIPIFGLRTADAEPGVKSSIAESPSDFNSCANELVSGDRLSGKDVNLLVKKMHCLSEVLLSSNNTGCKELKEDDHKLLQLAIKNLEAFIDNHKKDKIKANSDDSATKKMNCTVSTLDGSELEKFMTYVNEEMCRIKSNQKLWTDPDIVCVWMKYEIGLAAVKDRLEKMAVREKLEKKAKGEVNASENNAEAKACLPSSSNAPRHAQFSGSYHSSCYKPFLSATDMHVAATVEQENDLVQTREKKIPATLRNQLTSSITQTRGALAMNCKSRAPEADASDGVVATSKESPIDATGIQTFAASEQAKQHEVDPSVMATYDILEGRTSKLDAANVEQKIDFVKSPNLDGDIEKQSGDCSSNSRSSDSSMWQGDRQTDRIAETGDKSVASSCKSRWPDIDASDSELRASTELSVDDHVIQTNAANMQANQSDASDSDAISSEWELLVEDGFTSA